MKRKTKILVCIAVVLCIVLMAGIALAAPHMGYWHGDSRGRCQGFGTGTQTASTPHTQCAYPDCPSVTGKMGVCINEDCRYYQECVNKDCPRLTGGTCTNDHCPFTGQCAYPDCPSVTGKMGVCINEDCRYYQECVNGDCPRITGGTCTNDYCPFTGEQPQNGIDNGSNSGSTRNSGYGNGCHRGGHHSKWHH